MTLTLDTNIPTFIPLVVCIYQLSGHRLQYCLKNQLFSFFPIHKPVTKFDLVIKEVKVNPRSSLEQTMMEWSPQCYIPSFVEIGSLVPEILGVLTIYGHGGHLGHVTSIISMYLKAYI